MGLKFISPYRIKEVKSQRVYPGYVCRVEIIDLSDYNGDKKWKDREYEMESCYSRDTGYWLGSVDVAEQLCGEFGLRQTQKAHESDRIASIGFNEDERNWYGWRIYWGYQAICGFGIGDKLFEEDFGDDDTPLIEHGKKTVCTLEQAKQSAINFADSVSLDRKAYGRLCL